MEKFYLEEPSLERKYETIFESENILYVKINENLINDYLIMVNDPEVQKGISRKAKIYTYE